MEVQVLFAAPTKLHYESWCFLVSGVLRAGANLFRARLVSSAPTPVPAKMACVQPERPPLESFLDFPPAVFFFLVEMVGFSGWISLL